MVNTKPNAEKAKETVAQNGVEISKNGTEPKETKTGDTKPAVVKPLLTITPEKKENVVLPSLSARLKKLAELQSLVERRETLTEALDDVEAFDCKTPNANPVIRFTNNRGAGFQVSHSGVISDVVELLQVKLKLEIEEIESKISFSF